MPLIHEIVTKTIHVASSFRTYEYALDCSIKLLIITTFAIAGECSYLKHEPKPIRAY